jgi:hypothetical protein
MNTTTARKEKMILVALISTIVIFGLYALYVYQKYISVNPEIVNDFRFWGKTFLILIPVTIAAQIIIHILFAIINKIVTNEEISTISDERDKLIELKTIRISHWIFTFGFFLAMLSLAIGMQPWVMFITLILSGLISTIISELVKIYYYRRGF